MDCPNCRRPLNWTTYENVRVMQCEQCSGYLVARNRLKLIKSTREQTPEALRSEADREKAPDTQEQITCPHCRVESMKKERIRITAADFFFLDVCPKCDRVWLDGGELARLQIKYEESAQAVEEFARQRRLESLSEEQQTEFQQRVDKLRAAETSFGAVIADLGALTGALVFLVATLVSILFFGSRLASGLFSLLLAALLVYEILRRLDATSPTRLLALAVIGVLEVTYLACLALL